MDVIFHGHESYFEQNKILQGENQGNEESTLVFPYLQAIEEEPGKGVGITSKESEDDCA